MVGAIVANPPVASPEDLHDDSRLIVMLLGVFGVFRRVVVNIDLPPVLAGLLLLLGWGMCVPLIRYWKMSRSMAREEQDMPWRSPASEDEDLPWRG